MTTTDENEQLSPAIRSFLADVLEATEKVASRPESNVKMPNETTRKTWVGAAAAIMLIVGLGALVTTSRDRGAESEAGLTEQSAEFEPTDVPDTVRSPSGPTTTAADGAAPSQASELLARLEPELAGRAYSRFVDGDRVAVALFADQEAFATELLNRFADDVSVMLGAFPYPMPAAQPDSLCQTLPDGQDDRGLQLSMGEVPTNLDRRSADGRSVRFETTLTNTGDRTAVGGFGAATGHLVSADGRVVADVATLTLAAVATPFDLDPGEATVVQGVLSLASCDPIDGHLAPAGIYELVALISLDDGTTLVSDGVRVEVE